MSWTGTIQSGCIVWGLLGDLTDDEHVAVDVVSGQSFAWVVIR